MFAEIIEKFTKYWGSHFFIEPILILTFICCFIVGLFRNNREKERFFFLVYFFIGMSLFVVFTPITIFHLITGRKWVIIIELGNTIFELSEFIAFYQFFKKCLRHERYSNVLRGSLICLCVIAGTFCFASLLLPYPAEEISKHSLFINVIELFFIFCMCLAYYYDLFRGVPKVPLFQRPSFFITTSTFFYAVLLIPFLILANEILQIDIVFYHILFAVHFLLLVIVLLTILKAFLWQRPITT
jgi:hypothetical protein